MLWQIARSGREIPDFPTYRITEDGRLFNRSRRSTNPKRPWPRWREYHLHVDKRGYALCQLTNGKTKRVVNLHRLLAEVFIPNPDSLPCVRHLDGNARNSVVANLAWGTYSDNENDKKRHGTFMGAVISNSKLTREQRVNALERVRSGESHTAVAKSLNVTRSTIGRLAAGKTWVWENDHGAV